jgi:hypothetical protein
LSAHFLDKQILTPHTPKKFQTYLYQRKVLMRINPNAESGSPPTEGETVWHEVYCTRCHKEPENRYKPGGGYWLGLPEVTEDGIKRFRDLKRKVRSTSFWLTTIYQRTTARPGGTRMGTRMGARMRASRRISTRIWAPWWTNLKILLVVMRGLRLGASSSDECRWIIVDGTL